MRTRNCAHALTLSVASMAAVLSLTLATPNAGAAPTEPDPTAPTTSAQPAPETTQPTPPTGTEPSVGQTSTPTSDAPSSTPTAPTTSDPSTSAPSSSSAPQSTDAPKSSTPAPKPQARAAVAAGCQTNPPTSYQVCGRIRDKYNQLNGPNGYLLFPKSNELTNPNNTGKRSEFVGGNIYWSTATDAHPVAHDFLTKWGQYGYEGGFLKYPTTDEIPLGIGVDGRRQEFQGGYLYFDFPSGTHNVQGAILDKYKAMGGPGSYLGFPTSDETVTPDGKGRYNYFQNGAIYWSSATGAFPITGTILDQWASAGFEKSSYGYPVADPTRSTGGGSDQKFQNGRIYSAGLRLPIGNSGFSIGLNNTNQLTTSGTSAAGISFNGPGFSMKFQLSSARTMLNTSLKVTSSQAPKQFDLPMGLPNGYKLQHIGSEVVISDASGKPFGSVEDPTSLNAAGQASPVQVSIIGATIRYVLPSITAFPADIGFNSLNSYNPYYRVGPETSKACAANPYDCARSVRPYFDATDFSEADFSNLIGPDGSYLGTNDALDADRHCLWQALTTEAANADFAKKLGDAHEADKPNGVNAGIMDQWNNITGRHLGRAFEGDPTSIRSACRYRADNPRVITDISTVGSNADEEQLIVLEGDANTTS